MYFSDNSGFKIASLGSKLDLASFILPSKISIISLFTISLKLE